MLAHWSKFWVMFSRRPHRLMWSGTFCPADRAEVDGVEGLQGLQAVLGHHPAGLRVVLAAPGELVPLEGEPAVGLLGEEVEDAAAGGDDLLADAVGGDRCDLEDFCCVTMDLLRLVLLLVTVCGIH